MSRSGGCPPEYSRIYGAQNESGNQLLCFIRHKKPEDKDQAKGSKDPQQGVGRCIGTALQGGMGTHEFAQYDGSAQGGKQLCKGAPEAGKDNARPGHKEDGKDNKAALPCQISGKDRKTGQKEQDQELREEADILLWHADGARKKGP